MILRDSRGILSDDLIWCSQGISRDMVLGHLMASWEGIWGLRGVPGPLWPLVALIYPLMYYCVYMYTPAMHLSPYVTRSLSDGARDPLRVPPGHQHAPAPAVDRLLGPLRPPSTPQMAIITCVHNIRCHVCLATYFGHLGYLGVSRGHHLSAMVNIMLSIYGHMPYHSA